MYCIVESSMFCFIADCFAVSTVYSTHSCPRKIQGFRFRQNPQKILLYFILAYKSGWWQSWSQSVSIRMAGDHGPDGSIWSMAHPTWGTDCIVTARDNILQQRQAARNYSQGWCTNIVFVFLRKCSRQIIVIFAETTKKCLLH